MKSIKNRLGCALSFCLDYWAKIVMPDDLFIFNEDLVKANYSITIYRYEYKQPKFNICRPFQSLKEKWERFEFAKLIFIERTDKFVAMKVLYEPCVEANNLLHDIDGIVARLEYIFPNVLVVTEPKSSDQKTRNADMLQELLSGKRQYSGIQCCIDWTAYSDEELTELILENNEQTLMRFHILKNKFINDADCITQLLLVYSERRCQTFCTIAKLYAEILDKDIVIEEFRKRSTRQDSYANLHEVMMLRVTYAHKLNGIDDNMLKERQDKYELEEYRRHRSYASSKWSSGASH